MPDMTPDTPHRRLRILVAKVGLDGHDRGAKVVVRALRDAGMEVIYTGLHRTAEEVAHVAAQEDVDVLGVSTLSGAHATIFRKLHAALKAEGLEDLPVVAGGIVPEAEREGLGDWGVRIFWGPGTKTGEIVEGLLALTAARDRTL